MPILQRVLNCLCTALVGTGLWFLWPEAAGLLKGTWFHDLRFLAAIPYVLVGLWIAERCWLIIDRHVPRGRT